MGYYGDRFAVVKGILGFHAIYEKTKPSEDNDKTQYVVTLYIPKSDTKSIDAAKKLMDQVGQDEFGGARFQIAMKDVDDLKSDPPLGIDDHMQLRATSSNKPPAVFTKAGVKATMPTEVEFYAGCKVGLHISPWTWVHKTNGNGVSLNPVGIRLLGDGPKLVSRDPEKQNKGPDDQQVADALSVFAAEEDEEY